MAGNQHHNGVARYIEDPNTASTLHWYSNQPVGCAESSFVKYFNDFLVAQDYAAADWVVTTTEAGSGDATEALAADELNGALLITNDNADNDLDALQGNEETWKLASGKKCWFETKLKISDATQTDLFVGLAITDTTVLDTTDRVGFQKDDGDTNIDFLTEKDSTETNTDTGSDAVANTYVTLSFYWDGSANVYAYVDRVLKATHTANIPDDENLALTVHLQNGEAAAKTCTIDYLYVLMER